MRISSSIQIAAVAVLSNASILTEAFTVLQTSRTALTTTSLQGGHPSSVEMETKTKGGATKGDENPGFIETGLRAAAMKLHTRSQAPKEGQAPEPERKPYKTTMDDYLYFLIDNQHVFRAMEEIINLPELQPELTPFVDTGLERTERLETDIQFILNEYYEDGFERPAVGPMGEKYAKKMWDIAAKGKDGVPEFMCHYFNHYFAHTAGGRMIGKQMSAMLLDKKTLEYYKWDGDINKIKTDVKNSIEELAATWSQSSKDRCVGETKGAFQGGGGLNSYLGGARNNGN
jgi:heme oxygenase